MPFFAFTKGLGNNQNTGNSQSMQSLARTAQFQQRLQQQGRLVALQEEQSLRDEQSFTVEQKIQRLRADKMERDSKFDAGTLRMAEEERQAATQMKLNRFDRMQGEAASPEMEDHAQRISQLAGEFPEAAGAIYSQGAIELAEIKAKEVNDAKMAFAEQGILALNPPPAEGEEPNGNAERAQKKLAEMLKLVQETGDPGMTESLLDNLYEVQHTLAQEDNQNELRAAGMGYMQARLDSRMAKALGDGEQIPGETWEVWEAANEVKLRMKRRGYKDPRVGLDEFDKLMNARTGDDLLTRPRKAVTVPPQFTQAGKQAAAVETRNAQAQDPAWRATVIAGIDPAQKEQLMAALQSGQFKSFEEAAKAVGMLPIQALAFGAEMKATGQADAAMNARGALLDKKSSEAKANNAKSTKDTMNARVMSGGV